MDGPPILPPPLEASRGRRLQDLQQRAVRPAGDLWLRRHDHDHLLAGVALEFHELLLGALQVAGSIGLRAKDLDAIHQACRVRQECVAQTLHIGGPGRHHRQYLREGHQ